MKRPSRVTVDVEATVALAESGLRTLLRSKLVWLALAASAVHIAIRVAMIAFLAFFAPEELPFLFNAEFYISTIVLQAIPFIVVGAVVGAGVTARDRMMGGLEYLLSKALPPWGYVLGRLAPPTAAALALFALPILIMNLLLIALVSPLPTDANRIMWGTFAFGLLASFTLGPLSAGLGTLTENPRRAIALWLGVVWLSSLTGPFADEMGVDWWWAFSPLLTVEELGRTFAGARFGSLDGEWFAWVLCILFALLPMAALWYRTREVVR